MPTTAFCTGLQESQMLLRTSKRREESGRQDRLKEQRRARRAAWQRCWHVDDLGQEQRLVDFGA